MNFYLRLIFILLLLSNVKSFANNEKLKDDFIDITKKETLNNISFNVNEDSLEKIEEIYNTLNDSTRIEANIVMLNNLSSPISHIGYEFKYHSKFNQNLWLNLGFTNILTLFFNIAENKNGSSTNINNSESEYNITRTSSDAVTLLIPSIGVMNRFKLLTNYIKSEKLFETMSVNLAYLIMQDSFTSKTFKGYGLKSDYSIEYRYNKRFFYGMSFNYTWGQVSRTANSLDFANDRTLLLSWLSLGFNLGLYF